MTKCFSNYIPINIISKVLNEEVFDKVIDEIVNNKDFEKSDTEIETYDTIEELKFPQDYQDGGIIILDDLTEEEIIDSRVQAMFKRSRHHKLSKFTISEDYYELPMKTIRANGNIYHIFKPNSLLDVCNIYQDKPPMDITLVELKYLTSTCWNEHYQRLTIDMTKDKYTGRFRLGLNSLFVPNTSLFEI